MSHENDLLILSCHYHRHQLTLLNATRILVSQNGN